MGQIQQKLQFSATIIGISQPVSGYDVETGNSAIGPLNQYFPASSSNVAITMAFTLSNLQSIAMISDKGCTLATNGTSTADVQTITITGTPTGGDFPLVFDGQATIVAWDATASNVQSALQALSTIGSGNVTCTGGPLPGTAVVCTFAGTKATGQQPLMTTYSGNLTGGSSPTVAVAHTTPGEPSQTIVLQPGIPVLWGTSMTGLACPFTANVTAAYVSNTPAQYLQIAGTTL